MKAIVHIGSPKAGSSSIQDFLFLNTDRLARQGFRFHRNVKGRGSQYEYPLAIMAHGGRLPHGEVERARYSARTPDEALEGSDRYLQALAQYPSRYDEPVALFSSEHILPWIGGPRLIRPFDEAFRAVFSDTRYVVYFRGPAQALLSQYSERIKRGYAFKLGEFVRQRLSSLDIARAANAWADTVGDDRINVRLFEPAALQGGDVIADYCAACGIDPTGLTRPGRVNTALNAPAAECMRMLNTMIPELRPDGSPNPLRADLLETVQDLSQGMPKLQLNAKQHALVQDHLAASLRLFRDRFFPGQDQVLATPDPDQDPLKQVEIQELAMEIMAQLLVKTRMGELRTLTRLERGRAEFLRPTPKSANTADAPRAKAQQT